MDKVETYLAQSRMEAVERQINRKLPKGVTRSIRCPYCGELNFHEPGKTFCCDLLRKAVLAVLIGNRAMKAAEVNEIVH